MARLGFPDVWEPLGELPVRNADERFDFTYNPEIGYHEGTSYQFVPIWDRWPWCKEAPIMMGASGFLLGFILGAVRVGRGRGRRGGGSRVAAVGFRAVAGGLMFGTLLFTSAFIFHCVFPDYSMYHEMPPEEANVMFLRPEMETEEEYDKRDEAADQAALKPYFDNLKAREGRMNPQGGENSKDV